MEGEVEGKKGEVEKVRMNERRGGKERKEGWAYDLKLTQPGRTQIPSFSLGSYTCTALRPPYTKNSKI